MCAKLMQPTLSLHCMYTFSTLQVHSNSIWVSTALATFACKRKPLTVYFSHKDRNLRLSAALPLGGNICSPWIPVLSEIYEGLWNCFISGLLHIILYPGTSILKPWLQMELFRPGSHNTARLQPIISSADRIVYIEAPPPVVVVAENYMYVCSICNDPAWRPSWLHESAMSKFKIWQTLGKPRF